MFFIHARRTRLSHAPRSAGYRELFAVAWPMILSTASYSLMHFFDRLMLTRYSEATAAAAIGAGIMSFAMLSFFFGIAQYTNTFIAQYYGAKEPEMCARSMWQGVYFALIAGALFPVTFGFLGRAIIVFANHPPEVMRAELVYFSVLAYGAVFPLLSNALSSFFSGRGDTRTIMYVNFFIASLNVFLNYCLIFGHFGMPELGIRGAAYATVTSAFLGTSIFALCAFRKKWRDSYGTLRYWHFRKSSFMRLIRYGGPSGMSFGLDITAFALFTLLVGRLGTVPHIASNIVITIHSLAFIPMLGFSIATTILVGKYIGQDRHDLAESIAYKGVSSAAVYMLLGGAFFVIFPRFFFTLFQGDGVGKDVFESVYAYGRPLLYMMVFLGVFDAVNVTMSAALKGAGDTVFTMWTNVLLAWGVFVPPVYIFTSLYPRSIYYSWACFMVYVFLLAAVYFIRFRGKKWQNIVIRETVIPSQVSEIVAEARPVEN